MGGGDKKKEDEGATPNPSATCDSLSLSLVCQYDEIPLERRRETPVSLLVRIKAVSELNEDRRAPVTLIATIDRSASMKDKLPLVKESLQFMVQQLREEDKLALITFDHEVSKVLPLTSMNSAGKVLANKAIDSIQERGHTNLSGGLLAALQMLYEVPASESTLVESIVLFTDGKANFGIKDPAALAKATRSMLDQIGRQACVFTLGYGADHDPDTLHAVSDAGKGLFYYVENKDNIPDSFCDCLGGLLSVAAQNIILHVSIEDTLCTYIQPLQTSYVTEKEGSKSFKVTIPDIYCEEEKCIPVHLKLSTSSQGVVKSKAKLLTCSLSYFDVLQCAPRTTKATSTVLLSQSITEPVAAKEYQEEIEIHVVRCEVAESLATATKLADRGDLQSARDMLHRCKAKVKKGVMFGHPLAKYIEETIDDSLSGLATKERYVVHGKPTMMSHSHAHYQQRSHGIYSASSTCGASPVPTSNPYVNSFKTKMKVTYAEVKKS